jgi:phage FluMu protein Com
MGVTASAMTCFSDLGLCNEEPKLRAENSVRQREETIEKAQVKEEENNEKYLVPLKRKIDELCEKRDKAEPFICANGGNACNNPCYEYQTQLETKCPKCGGAVNKEFENGKTIERKYIKKNERYEDVTVYDDNVCSKFNWVKTYLKIDMNSYAAMKYFTRQKKIDDKKTAEYFCIDGEKFDAPPGQSFLIFFMKNNSFFFSTKK